MKWSTDPSLSPKRLFVPVNEFEFDTFAVHVRRPVSRRTRAVRDVSTLQQRPKFFWVLSPMSADS